MPSQEVDVVKLPRRGLALIASDLHGNLKDFHKLLQIWQNTAVKDKHLIFTGDFIHAMGTKEADNSLELLEEIQLDCKKYPGFHLLLGNHEWATITGNPVYKGGVNQSLIFEKLLKDKYGSRWKVKLAEYSHFFKKLPVAVKTSNGVFISHSGPPENVKSLQQIMNITRRGYSANQSLFELLWRRYHDYSKQDVDQFLEAVGCQAMIVGHTPVDGYKLYGNQLIISSSYTKGRKAYVELDLKKDISNGGDLKKMVRYLR
ncbi:metallophosphoesterase [Methanobacterium formicicum]|jgi:hypothetical protein|uniref:Metallophosphoesterase n=1 Tax=Methanobacterium formicicum TaxID=2162 RepID=A0A843AXL6_METFO|nr:metallophosphoesterase [Methanobacterium formicicum]MBF4475425.1 metallophosphoesterase [Methanobacterium formicicum]